MQSHPLRRTRFGQYQASSGALGDREMGTAISCIKCSQVAGLIQKVGMQMCVCLSEYVCKHVYTVEPLYNGHPWDPKFCPL